MFSNRRLDLAALTEGCLAGTGAFLLASQALPAADRLVTNISKGPVDNFFLNGVATLGLDVLSLASWYAGYRVGSSHAISQGIVNGTRAGLRMARALDRVLAEGYNHARGRNPNQEIDSSSRYLLRSSGLLAAVSIPIIAYSIMSAQSSPTSAQAMATPIAKPIFTPTTTPIPTPSPVPTPPSVPTSGSGLINTGELAGSTLGDEYKVMIGISGTIASSVPAVDFGQVLKKMWDYKLDKYKKNGPELKSFFEKNVRPYVEGEIKPTTTTLDAYISDIDKIVNDVNGSIDWNVVEKSFYGLDQRKLAVLKRAANMINGRDIAAYLLTEIMPSMDNGKVNKAAFEFLLRNAGIEFVELIPSMNDDLISFGPAQITKDAVSYAGPQKPDEPIGGASKVNLSLPQGKKIPDKVEEIKGKDHYKTAQLLAINNLAILIAGLDDTQVDTLERGMAANKLSLVEYIATAHNNPAEARAAARRWLDNRMQYEFVISTSPVILYYAQKTAANYRALNPGPTSMQYGYIKAQMDLLKQAGMIPLRKEQPLVRGIAA